MKILVTGATGMLGQALTRKLASRHQVQPFSSKRLDITSWEDVRRCFKEIQPDFVVHAAAFTRVDEAENRPDVAYRVNALGTRNIAGGAHEWGCPVLYFSTDYVFDGRSPRPYREWDCPNPVNEYGRSKLAGEFFLRILCPKHLIIRTSWLFGSGGSNFVQAILQTARQQKYLEVVDDQRGCPTLTEDLAQITLALIDRKVRGIYHVTNSGECSRYEFAREIIRLMRLQSHVRPASSSDLPRPAVRPPYSVLDNYVLHLEGIEPLRVWQEALENFLFRLSES